MSLSRAARSRFGLTFGVSVVVAAALVGVLPVVSSAAATGVATAGGIGSAAHIASPDSSGVWLRLTWPAATSVNHIVLEADGNASAYLPQSIVSFNDGSSVMVTPDANGQVNVSITPRTVTSASIRAVTVTSGLKVAVRAVTIDGGGSSLGNSAGVAEASSGPAAALSDGAIAAGRTGATWHSATGDTAPWAGIRFSTPHEVSSVQLFGAPAGGTPGGAASWGDLVFGDGSSVRVTSVDAAGGQPTTIAFTPRVTTSVRYVPRSSGVLTLRELVVADRGVTLPRFPTSTSNYSVVALPAAPDCGVTSPAVGTVASGGIALVCPSMGSTVGSSAKIVVSGPTGSTVRASAWVPSGPRDTDGAISTVGTAVVDPTGRAAFTIDTSKLEHGPIAVRFTVDGSTPTGDRLLYLQLDNSGGVNVTSTGYAPGGMTLAWADDFASGVDASVTGLGAVYGTLQPQPGGAGQFGDAVFADPALGAGTIGTLDSSTLRLRAMPLTGTDSTGWGRTMQSGILSSGHQDGSGTLAQYGYFEVRALGAPGRGSWPAFWMMSGDTAVPRGATTSEIDAQEFYGHSPSYGCQTIHRYDLATATATESPAACPQFGSGAALSTDDWALRWHSYGVRVAPGLADFYIDGVLVTETTFATTDVPYYFMLDEALGGGYPVQLQQTGNVTDFFVDWVKVYS